MVASSNVGTFIGWHQVGTETTGHWRLTTDLADAVLSQLEAWLTHAADALSLGGFWDAPSAAGGATSMDGFAQVGN